MAQPATGGNNDTACYRWRQWHSLLQVATMAQPASGGNNGTACYRWQQWHSLLQVATMAQPATVKGATWESPCGSVTMLQNWSCVSLTFTSTMLKEASESIFNVPASCLPSPKPAPRPAKVEDQQLRDFLQKDKITSFDAFKPERNLQKQYKNLIISRSKERLVCLFISGYFSECSLSVIVENKPTLCSPLTLSAFKNDISVPLFRTLHPNNGLRAYTQFDETVRLAMHCDIPFDKTIQNVVTLLQAHTSACVHTEKEKKLAFLTHQLELLLQKQFSMNDYCFALQSYPKCNYEQLRDFLAVITPSLTGMALSPIPAPPVPSSSSSQLLAPFGNLDPSVLAASLAAAAAAAAGPTALRPQASNLFKQHSSCSLTPSTPNHGFPAPPLCMSAPLSSTPTSTSISLQGLNKSNSSLPAISVPSPLPGQLLIPSFYASKSPSGSVTYDSFGDRNSSLINSSGRTPVTGGKSPSISSSSIKSSSLTSTSHNTSANVTPVNRMPRQEKLTMKFKKSQFSPNEMVVVGSVRDALEQKDCRAVEKASSKTHTRKGSGGQSSGGGGRINAVVANLLEKVVNNSNNSLSVTHVVAPVTTSKPKPPPQLQSKQNKQPGSHLSSACKVVSEAGGTVVLAGRIVPAGITLTPATAAISSSVSIINQSQPSVAVAGKQPTGNAATINVSHQERIDHDSLKRLQEKIRAKKAEKAALKVKAKAKPLSFLHGNKPARSVGRPLGSTNSNRVSTKINATNEGRVLKLMNGGREPLNPSSDGKRKIRKCRQRTGGHAELGGSLKHQRSLLDNPDKLLPIDDTELGECAKTRFAQRMMLQLLRTTARLPMVEFSHAMDTIATLTDALRLKHRVELSVRNMDSADDGSFTLLGSAIDDDLSVSQKRRRMLQQLPFDYDGEGRYSDVDGIDAELRDTDGDQKEVVILSSYDGHGNNAGRSNGPKEPIELDGTDERAVKQGDCIELQGDSNVEKRKMPDELREEKTGNKRSKES
ncbi:hypothetical protein FHG87_014647 [Trinorchestia longiramus]|nr:hypothetical protein FHG87_014647 [Trinorchestia longiramus]